MSEKENRAEALKATARKISRKNWTPPKRGAFYRSLKSQIDSSGKTLKLVD